MIPVQPFTFIFPCERCRCETPHIIQFMSFDAEKHIVNFMATCEYCEEEADDDNEIVGFTASLPVSEWNKITPLADEIVLN